MSVPDHHNVAIVTGAAGGLGGVIVRCLAAKGYRVLAADINRDAIEAFAAEAGDGVMPHQLDVTDKAAFSAVLEHAKAAWGGVGVLVNNAAVTRTTPVFDIAPEEFDLVTGVALKGTFIGCQVVGAHMRENGYGRIVNIASLAGQNGGTSTGAHYAAAKGGILTLTKVFARELAASGVAVNAISPGPLDLDSVRSLLPPEKLAAVVGTIPAGTLGDPAYIAEMVTMLAFPQATSAIGATFDINGGLFMR